MADLKFRRISLLKNITYSNLEALVGQVRSLQPMTSHALQPPYADFLFGFRRYSWETRVLAFIETRAFTWDIIHKDIVGIQVCPPLPAGFVRVIWKKALRYDAFLRELRYCDEYVDRAKPSAFTGCTTFVTEVDRLVCASDSTVKRNHISVEFLLKKMKITNAWKA